MDILQFIGRLHILFLHLPIGFFIALGILELPPLERFNKHRHQIISRLCLLNAICTTITILFGLILETQGRYGNDIIFQHKIGGIILGILAWILYFSYKKTLRQNGLLTIYRLFLVLSLPALVFTAHLGGSLTHGETFLTKPLGLSKYYNQEPFQPITQTSAPEPEYAKDQAQDTTLPKNTATHSLKSEDRKSEPELIDAAKSSLISSQQPEPTKGPSLLPDSMPNDLSNLDFQNSDENTPKQNTQIPSMATPDVEKPQVVLTHSPIDYKQQIFPILEAHCIQCHGPSKVKGRLRLDRRSNMITGGTSALPTIIPGNPDESELIKRIELPPDDYDFMPPDGKTPIPHADIQILRQWIEEGAHWTSAKPLFENETTHHEDLPENASGNAKIDEITNTPSIDIQGLRDQGVIIKPAQWNNSQWIVILTHYPNQISVNTLKFLEPIALQIAELDLSRCNINNNAWAEIYKFKNLLHLHLDESNVKDNALKNIEKLKQLESLNLFNTKISNESVRYISRLKNLKKIHVWNTHLNNQDIARLQRSNPSLKVIQ